MYANGYSIPKDSIKAYIWFSVAVAQGLEDATDNKSIATAELSPAELAEAQRQVTRLQKQIKSRRRKD
jgi:hypothetical protein